ncbi:MAG: SGNH/GDSL hydrolase family protein [Planctomycetes bacterium]|nr:SGNH/GDSL hydrolase family protein [Planctomycetota bacterium]
MLHLALAALSLLAPAVDDGAAPAADAPPPLRLAIVGASVSDGFGLSRELEVACRLTPFLDGALLRPHVASTNLGDGMFFLDPLAKGREQLRAAREAKPDVLVAADFLFWFGYGDVRGGDDARLALLERGLALLDDRPCPVLVGDFPDMSPALKGSSPLMMGRPILTPSQLPSRAALERLNARLHAWADAREDVHVFAMSSFAAQLRDERPFELRGLRIEAADKPALLQSDLLHPTVKGSALFTLLVLDRLVQDGVLKAEDVDWSLERVEQAAWKATEAERAEVRERKARREERKRELEERRKRREEPPAPRVPAGDDERERDAA